MPGLIELTDGGIGCTVQDHGRTGHRHEGIPLSGCLDPRLADAANALVDNAPGSACIEIRGVGPTLRVVDGPVRVAVAAHLGRRDAGQWLRADGSRRPLPGWSSVTLAAGDVLRVGGPGDGGCAYLALSGGVQLPPHLGSRSTYVPARLGGLDGRALAAGDRLPCASWPAQRPHERRAATPPDGGGGPIRVVLGPQQGHFTAAAVETFLSTGWIASAEQDRMGVRLQGPALAHAGPGKADIVSDAVAPGAIQVPASGQPIVLLADCQTVGGYPKIATVIRADLPRLAHARPGTTLHFAAVDAATARQALHAQRAQFQAWAAALERVLPPASLDEAALYTCNLVSGMIRGDAPEPGCQETR